ncbi:SubName: Full=Uncharacterized protein {ECO:0000313/EMBL:CCA76437.1} [Serendipita indica DSM 11827]|uniref:Phosphatidylinositol-specific phospholipase C X domain-containing protein n=1 Tax=Serendipita indica (strain DSM 11827) TaxID=1109443 RepID=G4TYP4_SERID|nr:SubName: Full=Uncharacterized protein {ECO:0000313/EMBL:CCA76437.1} [Serendipita indica DSM 11827]CCA76437.1 hypothetical protein PIIN_10430 [Serendipita indica DSM 11827]
MRILPSLSFFSLALPLLVAALDESQMQAHLAAASGLLGTWEESSDALAGWMSNQPDSTTFPTLSIPGTHDSLAWNVTGIAAAFTKTQDLPLFKQLNGGVRFIDLRVGENNGMIQLYHGAALLDTTAQLADIFWGLYRWLDAHATETVMVSVKVDNGNSTASLQQTIYDLVTGQDVAQYWVQSTALPTLGEARHKAILLRRFAFDQLQNITPIGIDASSGWADNNAQFQIQYGANGETLYIEDFYNVGGNDLESAVASKYLALSANLDIATSAQHPDGLFISFVSGYSGISVTPSQLAQGNNTSPGMNSRALSYLAGKQGSRFGVVLFDFFGSDSRLAPATLGQSVDLSATPSGAASPSTTSIGTSHSNGAHLTTASSLLFPIVLLAVSSLGISL